MLPDLHIGFSRGRSGSLALEAAQGAPRDPRRDSRGDRSPWLPLESSSDSQDRTTDWFQIGKGVCQGCILSPCLFNLYTEHIMRNTGLDEAQAGITNPSREGWGLSASSFPQNTEGSALDRPKATPEEDTGVAAPSIPPHTVHIHPSHHTGFPEGPTSRCLPEASVSPSPCSGTERAVFLLGAPRRRAFIGCPL